MGRAEYTFRRPDDSCAEEIAELFANVFTQELWNDDWSDREQLRHYIHDLTGQGNSLTFGLYQDEELVGVSMGRVQHWYEGMEYCVDELCVRTGCQGQGLGTVLVEEIEKACIGLGLAYIFLMTESNVPAFGFYKKLGFYQLEKNAAFAKKLR